MNTVQFEKHTRNIPTRNGFDPVATEMKVCVRIPRRNRCILGLPKREHCARALVVELVKKSRGETKLKKCRIFTNTIDDLGHVIRPRKSEIVSHTIDVIKNIATHNNHHRASLVPWHLQRVSTIQ